MNLAFERMTIFCSDLDASLSFYCGLIGLVPVEEKVIEGAAAGGLLQLPPCTMRIALLAPSGDDAAILGLFEIGGVELDRMKSPEGRPALAQTALVLSTQAFDDMAKRLQSANVGFLTPPLQYVKRAASPRSPAGIYHEMIVYDPDGILVSIMQIDRLPEDMSA